MMREAGEEVMCTAGTLPAHCQSGHEGPAPLGVHMSISPSVLG